MMIDFDWCSEAGKACYPSSLNCDVDLGWPEGVKPDALMLKEHDLLMLETLRPYTVIPRLA
jgi:hypothetical protein